MQFKNTDPNFKNHTFLDITKYLLSKVFLSKKKKYWPEEKIKVDDSFAPKQKIFNQINITYIGHVTFLIQVDGFNILTDPVWSERASPVTFLGPKRAQNPGIKIENLPKIDAILISHNHYDHLDIETLKILHNKFSSLIITPLENDKLIKKHIPDAKIQTLNWGEHYILDNLDAGHNNSKVNHSISNDNYDKNIKTNNQNLEIYLHPARHWSSRYLFDKNKALWGTFIIKTSIGEVCFIGDSGYEEAMFKAISIKHTNIKVSLIPIGAYKPRWFMKSVHMDPSEALLTHKDLKSQYSIASHFDVFPLADESYGEARFEFVNKRKEKQIKEEEFIIPSVGKEYYFK